MYKHFYVSDIPNTDGEMIPPDAVDLLDPGTFGVIEITGLYRPTADDYITDLGGIDASVYGGMSVKSRTITLNLDAQTDMERMRLYRVLPYGKPRRFWIETNVGVFWIDGHVTGMPEGSDNNDLIANFDVTIKCPYPWFRSMELHEVEMDSGVATTVQQAGDIPSGFQVYAITQSASWGINGYTIKDSSGNAFAWVPGSSATVQRNPVGYVVKLVDTTPGITEWHIPPGHDMTEQQYLATLEISGLPAISSDAEQITVTVSGMGSYTVRIAYYDTYSGV
ncbi:MAG: hypothetical protein Q4D42_07320 [Eubacteriales bacterium]|nr:hypothetical protein [Eubacteriales bacterium]